MQAAPQLTEFGKIFLFLLTGIVLVGISFFVARGVAPRKPNAQKLSSYECGEEPEGSSWTQLNSGFYIVALIFLLFDVEMVFIFPWATVFGQPELIKADARWGWFSLIEMVLFAGILILGLVYVWVKGDLSWVRSSPRLPEVATGIPSTAYDALNQETYTIRPFAIPDAEPTTETAPAASTPPAPAFKRTFKTPLS